MTPEQLSRRTLLAAAGAGLAAPACLAQPPAAPAPSGTVMTKPIPSSGEALPVVGIGTARVFDFAGTDTTALEERKAVVRNLVAGGGKLIDTAASYGQSEERLGDVFAGTGLRPQVFLATKCTASSPRDSQISQFQRSLERMKTDKVELMQLHNVGNANQDFGLLREWKAQGKCKYIGMSTTSDGQYAAFEEVLRREKPDFIQVDYAMDERGVEARLLPAARDMGAAVLTALPFGRNRLFSRVQGVALPGWAAEIGATSWAQVFLKFLISHPAVNAVIPGTDKPEYMLDNLGAGRGPMPDQAMRARMVAFIDALPAPAGGRG